MAEDRQSPKKLNEAIENALRYAIQAIVAAAGTGILNKVDWGRVWEFLTSSVFIRIVAICVLLAVGRALFWIRENYPRMYGWIEVVIGAMSIFLAIWVKPNGQSSNFEQAIKISSGLYLMVRGHDNRINGFARWQTRHIRGGSAR